MTNDEKFRALWDHVTVNYHNTPSPMMLAVGTALQQAVHEMGESKTFAFTESLRVVGKRIAEHKSWHTDGTTFIPKVTSEWPVTNADLEMWGDLSLFGDRDYFPDEWHVLRNDVGPAIKDARVWQTYTRYIAGGRLTDDHRKLLRKLLWDQNVFRGDGVSLYVQGKRPFGNSSREQQIARILGWEYPSDEHGEPGMPPEMVERAWEIFDELRFAIQDALK